MPTLDIDGYTVSVSIHPKNATDPTLYLDYYRPDRKRRRVSTGVTDPDTAKTFYLGYIPRIEAEVRSALKSRIPTTQANPLLSDIVLYYLETYLPNKHVAPKTITKSRQVLREWLLWCSEHRIGRLQQLSRAGIDAHVTDLRIGKQSANSIAARLGIIRACLNAGVDGGLCESHPVKKWLMPVLDDPEIVPLSPEELALVLAAVRERTPESYPPIAWMAFTGNRPSDTVDLRWRHVDRQAHVVSRTQTKTSRLASYEISDAAAELLDFEARRHKPVPDAPAFTNRHGEPFSTKKLYRNMLSAVAGNEHIPQGINLKTLRHTFGHIMVNILHCPLPTVQVLMGHADIKTTLKYVRPGSAHGYVNGLVSLLNPKPKKRQGTDTPRKGRSSRAGQNRGLAGASRRGKVRT